MSHHPAPPGVPCDVCGAEPRRVNPSLAGRWEHERPDPELPHLAAVLCPRCVSIDPAAVTELILRRRRYLGIAFKAQRRLRARLAQA